MSEEKECELCKDIANLGFYSKKKDSWAYVCSGCYKALKPMMNAIVQATIQTTEERGAE